MGMFDNASFNAPNVSASVVPSLENFLQYKRFRDDENMRNQVNMQKDMANFQSNLRLKEMSDAMDINRIQKSREPLNVLPPTGLVTPAMDAQMQMVSERNKLTDENNRMRNQIAQQNADTNREKAGNTLTLGRERLETQQDIARTNNEARMTRQNDQQEATSDRDRTRQEGRVELQNTRGNQIMNQIHARGEEDRLTKATSSPNVNANNPSQQTAAIKMRANQFMNQNPDLAKWVTIDPNTGMPAVTPPSTETSYFTGPKGPTAEQHQRILGAIYGGSNPSYSTPSNTSTGTVPTGGAAEIYVMKDGRRFKLNNPSQLDAALKQGYTQVK